MNTTIQPSVGPPLKWLYLAWVGIGFSSLVITIIAAAVHGPPEPVVAGWGIRNFSVFAICLYSIGSLMAVVVLARLLKKRGLSLRAIGAGNRISFRGVALSLAGLLLAFGLYPAVEASMRPLGLPMFWGGNASTALQVPSRIDLILVLVFAVVIGPITEEIIFRGYLVTALGANRKTSVSVYVLSSLIFASVHVFVGPGTVVFILFWSFIPTYLFRATGSLYPPILFHVLNNFVTYVVFPLWLME